MGDNFEHKVAEKASEFQLNPSPLVWEAVEVELNKNKRRRSPLFWWLPLGMLIISGGIYFLNRNTRASIPLQTKQTQTVKEKAVPTQASKIIALHLKNNLLHVHVNEQNNNGNINETITKNRFDTLHEEEKATSIANNLVAVILEKPSDSTVSTKNNLADNITANKATPVISKKHSGYWALNIGAGITNINQSPFLQNNIANNNAAYTTIPNTTVSSNSNIALNSGFHLQIGISRHLQLAKRWEVEIGMKYRYLQNKQSVGLKIDSLLTINSLVTDNNQSTIIPNYYLNGNNSVLTNSAHWLMLPILIRYNLNPSSKLKWQLYSGANVSWNFMDKWLLPDNASQISYYSKPLTNQILFNIQAGLSIQLIKDFKLGIGWETSLNSLSKLKYNKNYWNQYNLQFSKPIQLSKSIKHKN
jgi:hypothetical protein